MTQARVTTTARKVLVEADPSGRISSSFGKRSARAAGSRIQLKPVVEPVGHAIPMVISGLVALQHYFH